jgi:polygalacturonase
MSASRSACALELPSVCRKAAPFSRVYDPAGPGQPWESYQDYGHNHWNNSLFVGDGISDFSIFGPGLIHDKGLSFGQAGHRGNYENFTAEQSSVGNKAIALKNCRNVLLRDFPSWRGATSRSSRSIT